VNETNTASSRGGVRVYVGLGSNLGDSVALLRGAMERMGEYAAGRVTRSSLWWSRPEECPEGSRWFLNAVVSFVTKEGETPESLLGKLQALEREFGREPKRVLNEARLLDLDLIAFGDEVRSTVGLSLPHPRAHLRRFVLEPLSEIASGLRLPGQERTVSEILGGLGGEEWVVKWEPTRKVD
jgi:2-amino-4-hydroxy-6-hydroxymethyldihydropteridine diphosphokinase